MDIILKTGDWGGCSLLISFRKIDLLPRITISEMTGIPFMMDIGFLMFTFNLTVFGKQLRNINKRVREEGLQKVAEETIEQLNKTLEELKNKAKQEDVVEN